MTRSTFVAFSVSVLVGAVSSAQTPAQPGARQPAGTETAQTMTLTGCLQPWNPATMHVGTTTTTGTSGTSGTTAAPVSQQYVLTGAEHAATPGTTAPGATQPPIGSSPDVGAHDTYLLKPAAGMDLAAMVNQKVQVMGTLMVAPNVRPGTAGVTGTGTTSTPTTTTGGTPTTSTGGTPTTSTGGTPTSSTGGTPTTSTAGAPTGTPTTGTGTMGTGTTSAAAMSQRAGAAAARSTFNITSITMVAKTCS